MKHRKRKPKPRFTGKQIILLVIAAGLLAGVVTGAIAAAAMSGDTLSYMKSSTDIFFNSFNDGINRLDIFQESLIKHGKIVIAVWLLAFTPVGGAVSILIIFARGIGYGFTTACLIRCYGAVGVLYGALLYLPQNIIMIPAYFFVTYSNIHFIQHNRREKDKVDSRTWLAYTLTLLIGCACVVAAALIETWLSPTLIGVMKTPS